MKKMTMILVGLLALNSAFGGSAERLKTGFGASVTASTTSAYLAVEQQVYSNAIVNGDFADATLWITNTQWEVTGGSALFTSSNSAVNGAFSSTNGWKTNGILWTIAGGYAEFISADSDTGTLSQVSKVLSSGTVYRVDWTLSATDGLVFATASLGDLSYGATGDTHVANGTYSDVITAAHQPGVLTNLQIIVTSDGIATCRVDSVALRQVGLSQNNDISQTMSNITAGQSYRVRYTVAGMDSGNSVQVLVGGSTGTVRTLNGTYNEDVVPILTSNLAFRAVDTNTSSFTIDNVYVWAKPIPAYAYGVEFSVSPTDIPVYVLYSCSGDTFTNAYNAGTTMIVSSNRAVTVEQGNTFAPVYGIWYRTASGSATLGINAY